jgi:hypothetical protein
VNRGEPWKLEGDIGESTFGLTLNAWDAASRDGLGSTIPSEVDTEFK